MIVCINPWVHDFTSYDLWAKPLGLMELYSWLRSNGIDAAYIDLLYQYYPEIPDSLREGNQLRADQRAHFIREEIPKPEPYQTIGMKRRYFRFGMPEAIAEKMILGIDKPEMFLVTSIMTYWYPGVFETITLLKRLYPGVPVVLGGIYAKLCTDHAVTFSGADHVVATDDYGQLSSLIERYTGRHIAPCNSGLSLPLRWDVYPGLKYIPLRVSEGCPYNCPYCASRFIKPVYTGVALQRLIDEYTAWYDTGIRHFAFYDDALLVDSENIIKPFLRYCITSGKTGFFHTPNAVHVNLFDDELAELAGDAQFGTLRFGFETIRRSSPLSEQKTDMQNMEQLADRLQKAGIPNENVRIYLITGMPGQIAEETEESINFIRSLGFIPIPNEYSPVPHTPMFDLAVKSSPFDIVHEPLYHNKTIVPCRWEGQTVDDVQRMKFLARH